MTAMLHIRTFGGLSIWLDNVELHFDARSAKALLVYLACQGRPVEREALAEFLWPERPSEQARSNLRVALHRLHQQLEPYLRVTRQSIALDTRAGARLDSAQFEADLAAGEIAPATALYAGDFLADFYLDGSPAFEQWALLERERLQTLAIAAYQRLIAQLVTSGQAEQAINTAQRLLQLDPLHEPIHRQLMRLLAQTGQRSAALGQYALCRQLLDTELGVPPDEVTTQLYEQIRSNDAAILSDWPAHGEGASTLQTLVLPSPDRRQELAAPALRHNLPAQPTPFIGREAELAQIGALLANPDCRLLSLLCIGGMGKTRLAIEAASRQIDAFADGVYFVPLASVASPELLVTAIAQQLNISPNGPDLLTEVITFVRQRQILIVLDNFEHLVEASELIIALLRQAPRLKVLVTSRTRLQLVEEWLLPVDGLAVGTGLLGAAAQLFLRSAQRVQPAFSAAGQGDTITAICRQLGGMPLAIELAASWVRVMPCAEIAHQLAQNFKMLTTSLRNMAERHRSIRALFDQSWRLLSGVEQTALMRLSVFRGGWTFDEARPVTEASVEIVLALVDKSLVRNNGSGRYDLHELVRHYASEQLAASSEMETIRHRHFTTYLALARTADSELRGPDAIAWFTRLEAEQGNLREALGWAWGNRRYDDVAWLSVALGNFWMRQIRWREALGWLEPVLVDGDTLPTGLRLALLTDRLSYCLIGGQNHELDRHAAELKELIGRCEQKALQAAALFMLGMVAPDPAQSASLYADAIALVRQCGQSDRLTADWCMYSDTDFLLANLLFRHGNIMRSHGDYAQATALFQESLALLRAKGERDTIAYPLGNLGRLALIEGDLLQARRLLGEATAIAHAVGSTMSLAEWPPYLALVELYQGHTDEAWRLLQQSLAFCKDIKDSPLAKKTMAIAALIRLQQGALDEAEQFLRESLAGHRYDRWIKPELVDCLFTSMRLAAARQQFKRAAEIFGLAERLQAEIHHRLDQPVRPLVEAALEQVRNALDPVDFMAARKRGQALSLDDGFAQLMESHGLTNQHSSRLCNRPVY